MQKLAIFLSIFLLAGACGSAKSEKNDSEQMPEQDLKVVFNEDSAFYFVSRQVEFGPRVPNTDAHDQAASWLMSKLREYGAEVTVQKADLKAFDGTMLHASNIIGQYNPDAEDRLLLMAHYDCRPMADEDPDEASRSKPVDGANDGASGVGILLEIARQVSANNSEKGIDILFVDAEDYGSHDDDDSWALGSKYFATHPFKDGYLPSEVILLDMVGGKDARFYREYFSQKDASSLVSRFWACAGESGYGDFFPDKMGGAVNDDHIPFLEQGIPAIDIIEFHPVHGFNSTWHTTSDTIDNIDPKTLKAVGQTLLNFIYTHP